MAPARKAPQKVKKRPARVAYNIVWAVEWWYADHRYWRPVVAGLRQSAIRNAARLLKRKGPGTYRVVSYRSMVPR